MRIEADLERCQGAGMCALTAPQVFDQGEDDGRVVVLEPVPPPELEPAVARAAGLCPNRVIRLVGVSRADASAAHPLVDGTGQDT